MALITYTQYTVAAVQRKQYTLITSIKYNDGR
jgi:hypothetical protein